MTCHVNADSISTPTTTTIEGRLQFPDKTPFNFTTRIILNHGEFSTYSRADGSFAIPHVPPGIHVLNIASTVFHFSQIKLQVPEPDSEGVVPSPKCLEYLYPGAKKQVALYPLVLTALATYDYFEHRKGFSVWSILGNPMILMMLFSGGMMFMMPKLMEGMDPEEKERMKKQMEMQSDPTKMLSQLWSGGGFMDDTTTSDAAKAKPAAASSPGAAGTTRKIKNKN